MLRTGFVGFFLMLCAPMASAEPFSSAYSSTAPKDCRRLVQGEASSVQACRGLAGMQVIVSENDLRFSVSYGPRAEREPAAKETFTPIQSVSETLEWRYDEAPRARKPIATILRWHLASQDEIPRREILVVTRLPPGPVCWVALVDARANKNANDLARQAADSLARSFRCGMDKPAFLGIRGAGVSQDYVATD